MFGEIPISSKLYNFLPVLPVYCIIIIVNISMFKYFIFDGSGFSLLKLLTIPPFLICSFMTVLTHSYSMFTDPGKVEPNLLPTEVSTNNDELFCKKCNKRRPARTHHCRICQRCVLKMDHHCPWVANCVGYNNQKYFYQFLFYSTLGDFIAFLCLLFRLFQTDFNVPVGTGKQTQLTTWDLLYLMRDPIFLIIGTMTALAMTAAIGFLFFFQTHIISKNQTTLENKSLKDHRDNPYYHHEGIHNLKIVLGMQSFYEWFIPVFNPNVYNNGHFYTTPRDKDNQNNKNYLVLGDDVDVSQIVIK